jgi:hypothetical protein
MGKTLGPAVLIALIIACFPLQSHDLFWHLKTGEVILDGGIPRTDPFSEHTSGEWINHAWGFDVAAHAMDRAFGMNGLLVLRLILAAGLAGLLCHAMLRRGFGGGAALAVTALALALARHRLDLRPDALALVLFAVLLLLFETRKSRWVPLLLLAWVNLHASFILGVGTAAFLFGCAWWRERKGEYAALGLLSLAAPLVNPFGWKAYPAPLALQVQVKTMGLVNPEWQAPALRSFLPFFLAMAVLALLLLFRRRALRVEHLLLLPLGLLAFTSLRFMGFLAIAVPFFLPRVRSRIMAPAAALLSFAAFGFSLTSFAPVGWGVDAARLPVRETQFIQHAPLDGPMFNSPGFGGYLIYSLYPRQKVFWDGRNELYVPLLREVRTALPDSARWGVFLRKCGVEWALVKYQGEELVRSGERVLPRPWSVNHFPPSEWKLVFWDDAGMVFVRGNRWADPGFQANPESLRWIRGEMQAGRLDREAVSRELREKRKASPSCRRAEWLLTSLDL